MRAKVDQSICTGCGLCVDICPDVFAMEDGVAYADEDNLDITNIDDAIEAAETCPVEAITVSRS